MRHWLILSYFSNIDGMATAQHLDDRLPFLDKNGIKPILLTSICGKRRPGMIHATVPAVAPSGLRFELRHLRRRNKILKALLTPLTLLLLPFYLLEKIIIDLDSQWSWFPSAAIRGWLLCRKYKPQLIYSTGGPSSAHLAAALISRFTNLPWIAEFQDPLVHEDWLRSRKALTISKWLERFICKRASAVVFLTKEARDRAKSRTELGEKGWAIYPGANREIMPQVSYEKGPVCRFSHFGSLAGSRNLTIFLEALRLLFSENPQLEKLIRLNVYGSCDQPTIKTIKEFPNPETIHFFGRLPRVESLTAMKQSDVLLLVQNTQEFSSETIPSKTYEYFHSGRPVIGLIYKNPELSDMLIERGHLAADAASPEDVKRGILEVLERWQTEKSCPDRNSCLPLTVEDAVSKLLSAASVCFERNSPRVVK